MKLSIITINYNNRDGLRKTIDSIVIQTFNDYEWIVIDGGSIDGSEELIKQNAKHFSYWVSEPDKGVYNAMNKGLSFVHGEYVCFMNSGDAFYESTTLEKVFNEDITADLIYGDWVIQKKDSSTSVKAPETITLDFLYADNICHQASFIKSDIIQNYKFNENYKVVADWEIWVKMLLDGCSMHYVQQIICIFDGNDGISSRKDDKLIKEKNEMFDNTIPHCFLKVLKDNYRMSEVIKNLNGIQLTNNDLGFLRWHPRFVKLIKFCIKTTSRMTKFF